MIFLDLVKIIINISKLNGEWIPTPESSSEKRLSIINEVSEERTGRSPSSGRELSQVSDISGES